MFHVKRARRGQARSVRLLAPEPGLHRLQAHRGATLEAQGVEQGDAEVGLSDTGPGANNGDSDRALIEHVFLFHLL